MIKIVFKNLTWALCTVRTTAQAYPVVTTESGTRMIKCPGDVFNFSWHQNLKGFSQAF